MPIVERAPAWRRARPWLSAVAVVGLVLGALAGPALAQDRPNRQQTDTTAVTRLREPHVSHQLARPSTVIRFWVTYRNGAGSAPAYVRVLIDGHARAMNAASSSDQYRRGVRFVYATRLPAGRHRITFRAMSADGATASARGGTIRIVARRSGGASAGSTGVARPAARRLARRVATHRPARAPIPARPAAGPTLRQASPTPTEARSGRRRRAGSERWDRVPGRRGRSPRRASRRGESSRAGRRGRRHRGSHPARRRRPGRVAA